MKKKHHHFLIARVALLLHHPQESTLLLPGQPSGGQCQLLHVVDAFRRIGLNELLLCGPLVEG